MADSDDTDCTPEEALQKRHRKERKELQAQIQKLKHSVSKGDKKKKKEVTEQVARLESEMDVRHEKELADLQAGATGLDNGDAVTERLVHLSTADESSNGTSNTKEKKPSKAQKRRDKKAQQNKEREELIREQDIENISGARNVEFNKIKSILKENNLQIYEIPSDGNCLYKAVAHQLYKSGTCTNNEDLRKRCAQYMRDHIDDFLPFLAKDNGDLYTESEFQKYCDDVAMTTAWGGHLEIRALSHVLHQPMKVVQGEGPPINMGEEFEGKGQPTIVLAYHRHAFGLGEHYNSVEDYKEDTEFE